MGGTIGKLAEQGHDVLLLDLTDGEPTPLGDPDTRAREAAEAARILGVRRITLDLPNRRLEHSITARHKVAAAIRRHQAQILFTQFAPDAHPDHVAGTRIVEDARFDAKLTKIDLPGEPIYPSWLFYYYCLHLRSAISPVFLVDITGHEDQKREAILAYQSQVVAAQRAAHVLDGVDAANRHFGTRIGVRAAEPFFTREPLGLTALESLTLL